MPLRPAALPPGVTAPLGSNVWSGSVPMVGPPSSAWMVWPPPAWAVAPPSPVRTVRPPFGVPNGPPAGIAAPHVVQDGPVESAPQLGQRMGLDAGRIMG